MTDTSKKVVGELGETTACRFLMKRGFSIIERNYLKKWGEIDIIAKKSGIIHFVEVKTVSCENVRGIVTGSYRPEENVHPIKLQRLSRVIQTYTLERHLEEIPWQFDVVSVYLDTVRKEAKIELLEDLVL